MRHRILRGVARPRRPRAAFPWLVLLLAAASPRAVAAQSANARLDGLVQRHVQILDQRSPEWSTSVGLHSADERLDNRTAVARQRDSVITAAGLQALLAIDTTQLDTRHKVDWLLFRSVLETALFDAGARTWQRRPAGYVPFNAVYALAVGTEPAPAARMRALTARLEQWPAALALGRRQVVPSRTPQFWVDLDVGGARGIARYLRGELDSIVTRNGGDTLRFRLARDRAVEALDRYTAWMADTLRPAATGSWVYGTEAYDRRLRHSKLLDTSADSLIAFGYRVLNETTAELAALARAIDPSKDWRQLADSAKSLHPAADSVFAAYSAEAARARAFILEKGLFTLPEGERLDMVLTPPHLRQTYAYGGYSPAAAFEKSKVGRFFVTPVEPGSTPAQVESKLRGHNRGWITIVAVHEGYPGHHLQYARAATQPNLLRKLYGSEVFGEGWGLYSEELMYRNGFFPDSLARLTQLRMKLWRAARVIIDPSIHTGKMSFDQAVQFFVDSVGLERADATAEVTRYTTWPTQAVSYILGMRAIEALRDEARAALGDDFDLARFHTVVLEQGSLPPPLMRRAVLAELGVPAAQPPSRTEIAPRRSPAR